MQRLLYLFTLCLCTFGARAQLYTESFESNGEGVRYTSNELTTATSGSNNQYFIRAQNTVPGYTGGAQITNLNGVSFWASEGVRGGQGQQLRPARFVQLVPVSVANKTNLQVRVNFADARGLNTVWEVEDFIRVKARFNGTVAWTLIGQFTSDLTLNNSTGLMRRDSDLDGVSNPIADPVDASSPTLNSAMQDFLFSMPGTGTASGNGSMLEVLVEIDQAGLSEELAFDNIRIYGDAAASAAPVLANVEAASLAYSEGEAAKNITSTLTVNDADNSTLNSATVQITGNYQSTQDVLSFTNTASITGSFNSTTGTLTLTGSATLAQYATALQNVKYQNTNTTNAVGGNRVVTFAAVDGSSTSSNTVTRTIAITVALNGASALPYIEDFETDGEGTRYSSNTFLFPGVNCLGFFRAQPPVSCSPLNFTNYNGSFAWYAEGTMGVQNPDPLKVGLLRLAPVDATNAASLRLNVRLGSGLSQSGNSFQTTNYLRFFYRVNNGSWVLFAAFYGSGTVNGGLQRDTDLNGTPDGVTYNATLQNVDLALPAAVGGGNVDFQIEAKVAGQEEVMFDRIQISGTINNPPSIGSQTRSVAENTANTLTVGAVVSASDPDAGQTLSYAITAGNTNGAFAINSSNGQLTVANSAQLNFEATPSYSLTVQVTDNGVPAASSSATVTVNVTNVNEAPGAVTDANAATSTVAENAANGTTVGITASATDPDASTTLTYSLTDNAGGRFAISASTGVVTVANGALLNFESATSHSITVQASDGSLTSSQSFSIAVTNVNEAPSISAQSRAVNENAANGTSVGAPIAATDSDAGTTLSYSITAGNTGGAFSFSGNQLQVANSAALDFETTPTFSLTVQVSDGTLTNSATVTVNLNDVAEGPTGIGLSPQSLPENQSINTAVGNLSTTGPGGGYAYSLVSGAGSADNGSFAIVGSQLRTAAVFNFEGQNNYDIRIRSTDNANASLFTEQTFTITVTNVNEAPGAVTDANGATNTVAENAAIGTTVGVTTSATDPEGAAVTYALTDNAGGRFQINATTGVVTVANGTLLDFEAATSHSITVQASDGALTSSQSFSIAVTNVNEAPSISSTTRTLAENAANGTSVGAPIAATDPDAGTTLSYSITAGNTGGAFSFSGNQLQVANSAALNFEATPAYSLTVQVSDGTLTDAATVTVSLTNVNEAPTNLTLSNATIAENTGANVVVGSLSTTDPDAGGSFTYTLVSGIGSADNALVNINGDELRITADPDFETRASYAVRVRTTDQGGLSFERAFTLTITDVVETPANDPPTNIFLSNADVAENAANATVGLLTTADGDVADTHTYTLVSGTGSSGNAAFTIVGNSLRVGATGLDFETQASYSVRIRSTDSGAGNLFFEKSFTITVTDEAEALTVSTIQNVPGGLYTTITVTTTGVATLTGPVQVTGAFSVAGELATACQPITGAGSFTLSAGATLRICSAQGISSSGATGAVQVTGTRSFASDAAYVYAGTQAQTTGDGLPATVRALETANGSGVSLSQPTAVTTVLRLTSGSLATGNQLTLLSTATGTAYAVHSGGTTSGTVTVQRYVPAPAAVSYHHLSSPVQNAPVNDLATAGFTPKINPAYNNLPYVAPLPAVFPNVFGYDETRGGTTPAYAAFGTGYFSPATLGTAMVSGRGYSVYLPGQQTPDFVGALTTGLVAQSLTVTGLNTNPDAQKAGWHLLGNPYPQPIDWDLATVPAGMNASISVWYSTGGLSGAYRTRTPNGVGNLPDGLIGLGQAFFARATAPTTFTFTNALRVEENVGLGRPVAATRPVLTLALAAVGGSAPTFSDETFVYVESGATFGEDASFDGLRPGRNVGQPTLSVLIDGHEAAINALPTDVLGAPNTVLELTAVLPASGTYALSVGRLVNWGTTSVELLDRLTGTRYDLALLPQVRLTATRANEEVMGRFAVIINGSRVLSTHSSLDTQNSKLQLAPNPASASATVRVMGCAAGASVAVYDAAGRCVATTLADASGKAELPVRNLAVGVYAVRAADGRTTRLVVE